MSKDTEITRHSLNQANEFASLEKKKEYANIFIKSGLAPDHFKKPEDVIVVLQYGMEVGMTAQQSLQLVVPVNGLISIKGDGAKGLIQKSGLVESWKEEKSGTIEDGDYKVSITAKRKDTGEEMTSEFSIEDAKRAGLWISDNAVKKKSSLRYSPWYKYQKRMIRYRALGFIARDLFPDVLQGAVVEAEAQDFPVDVSTGEVVQEQIPEDKTNKADDIIQSAMNASAPAQPQQPEEVEDAEVENDEPQQSEDPKETTEEPKPSVKPTAEEKLEGLNTFTYGQPERDRDAMTKLYNNIKFYYPKEEIEEAVDQSDFEDVGDMVKNGKKKEIVAVFKNLSDD